MKKLTKLVSALTIAGLAATTVPMNVWADGDKIEISFSTGTKTVFDRLYLGAATDEDKSNYLQGTNTGSTCQYFCLAFFKKSTNS